MTDHETKLLPDILRAIAEEREYPGHDDRMALNHAAEALEAFGRKCDHLQSIIDNLMLEHCPKEMTTEQINRWAASQIILRTPPSPPSATQAAATSGTDPETSP